MVCYVSLTFEMSQKKYVMRKHCDLVSCTILIADLLSASVLHGHNIVFQSSIINITELQHLRVMCISFHRYLSGHHRETTLIQVIESSRNSYTQSKNFK